MSEVRYHQSPFSVSPFDEYGGQDGCCGAYYIKDAHGRGVATVETYNYGDCGSHDPSPRAMATAELLATSPVMLAALKGDAEPTPTPEFLDWLADRLVMVYNEPSNIDFVRSLRKRAATMREAIAKAEGRAK